MSNPLLTPTDLPAFSKIEPQYIEPAIKQLIEENRATVEHLLKTTALYLGKFYSSFS